VHQKRQVPGRPSCPDEGAVCHGGSIDGQDAVCMKLADLQPLPVEDHRYRFGDVCGGGDRSVADSGLPQFLDVAQHKCGRDEPAPVACALRRRPFAGVARVGRAAGDAMATAQKSAAASHVADLRTGYGWRRGLRVRSSKYLEALQRAAQMAFHPSSSPGEGYPIWQEDVARLRRAIAIGRWALIGERTVRRYICTLNRATMCASAPMSIDPNQHAIAGFHCENSD